MKLTQSVIDQDICTILGGVRPGEMLCLKLIYVSATLFIHLLDLYFTSYQKTFHLYNGGH